MRLKRTEKINEALRTLNESHRLDVSQYGDQWIDHAAAVQVGKSLKIPLFELFRGTAPYFEAAPQPAPKSAEYVRLMAKLKQQDEERQYQAMLSDSGDRHLSDMPSIKSITDEVNEQLTTVFNVLVSIGAVGWAFWYWCSNWTLATRTLMSLFAGMFAGIAEVVVYTGYLRRVDEAKARAKSHAESKRVVKEIVFHKGKETVISRSESPLVDEDKQKELVEAPIPSQGNEKHGQKKSQKTGASTLRHRTFTES